MLKILELKKIISIRHSDAEIFYVEVAQNQQLWQQLFYSFYFFTKFSSNMAANYVCIKQSQVDCVALVVNSVKMARLIGGSSAEVHKTFK